METFLKFIWKKLSGLTDVSPTFRYFYFNLVEAGDRVVNFFYGTKNFNSTRHINCSALPLAEADVLDLVTVAFNQPDVISWQIKFLKKNLRDKFNYTVADNSSAPEAALEIERICASFGVGYIRLPHNIYNGRLANWSHGLALNWLYKNFIKPRAAKFFGFLDHDILPVQPTAVLPVLRGYPMYGVVTSRGEYWYLWPGFSFFRAEVFFGRRVNFTAVGILSLRSHVSFDTGGGNWHDVYSKFKPEAVKRAPHYYAFLAEPGRSGQHEYFSWSGGQSALEANYDTNRLGENDRFIEFIGGWLHVRKIGYSNPENVRLKLGFLSDVYAGKVSLPQGDF